MPVTARLGENIQIEWDNDPYAHELWHALRLLENDPAAALVDLTDLAESGSTLSMVFLGFEYLSGEHGTDPNPKLGEEWLIRSSALNSIEGAYQLACWYQRAGKFDQAEAELKKLAKRGYSPAQFLLACSYYKGSWRKQNVPEALRYFQLAERAGHLYAKQWLSWIYRTEKMGFGRKLTGIWKLLTLIPPMVNANVNYPGSDRLRGAIPFAEQLEQRKKSLAP